MTAQHPTPARPTPQTLESLRDLGQIIEAHGAQSVLVVADPVAYERSGAQAELEQQLAGRQLTIFQDFLPNPNLEELQAGIEVYRRQAPDMVLAVGGGTAIDLAKLIRFFAVQELSPRAWILSQPKTLPRLRPMIAVPTTAGTGSEATDFAVLYIDGHKHSICAPCLRPEFAVLDASLTESMPPDLTAETGLDAFAHAIESMWSVRSTASSRELARESIQLTWKHLRRAVQTPTSQDRRAMGRAAHLAGQAICISKTTAPHALSYTITSEFKVAHGRAVALTLGPMLAYIGETTQNDCTDPRGVQHVRQVTAEISSLLGWDSPQAAGLAIQELMQSIGCPHRLSAVGVQSEEQIAFIASNVNLKRLANNPRRLTPTSLRTFLNGVS